MAFDKFSYITSNNNESHPYSRESGYQLDLYCSLATKENV